VPSHHDGDEESKNRPRQGGSSPRSVAKVCLFGIEEVELHRRTIHLHRLRLDHWYQWRRSRWTLRRAQTSVPALVNVSCGPRRHRAFLALEGLALDATAEGMNAAAIARDKREGDGPGFVGAQAASDERRDSAVHAIALGVAEVGRRLVKVAFNAAFDAIAIVAGAHLGAPHLALWASARPHRCLFA
jgi:hypothetical protein